MLSILMYTAVRMKSIECVHWSTGDDTLIDPSSREYVELLRGRKKFIFCV
jgi:hypothetical protein